MDLWLPAYHTVCKLKLSAKNICDYILFCQKYKDWTPEKWAAVMFTNGTMIKWLNARQNQCSASSQRWHDQVLTEQFLCNTSVSTDFLTEIHKVI